MIARRWLPPAAWAACILIATLIPGAHIPRVNVPEFDKMVHFVFYAVFAWLMFRALESPSAGRRVITVLLAIAVFAALDEFHQRFIPGRYMDEADWMADMAGAMIGLVVAAATRRRAVRA